MLRATVAIVDPGRPQVTELGDRRRGFNERRDELPAGIDAGGGSRKAVITALLSYTTSPMCESGSTPWALLRNGARVATATCARHASCRSHRNAFRLNQSGIRSPCPAVLVLPLVYRSSHSCHNAGRSAATVLVGQLVALSVAATGDAVNRALQDAR